LAISKTTWIKCLNSVAFAVDFYAVGRWRSMAIVVSEL
jgi:hypothetical protein